MPAGVLGPRRAFLFSLYVCRPVSQGCPYACQQYIRLCSVSKRGWGWGTLVVSNYCWHVQAGDGCGVKISVFTESQLKVPRTVLHEKASHTQASERKQLLQSCSCVWLIRQLLVLRAKLSLNKLTRLKRQPQAPSYWPRLSYIFMMQVQ